MRIDPRSARTLGWVIIFSIAFGYVESSVVVYLRAVYYPEGFRLPLRLIDHQHLVIEIGREAATIVMLAAVAVIAGSRAWERFGYFLVGFGIWDVFYYVWLKVMLNWPATLTDWDVLFLIPLPWIGPVIAPVLVALFMVAYGSIIVLRVSTGEYFRPAFPSWVMSVGGTLVLVYSFISDIPATTQGMLPAAYRYELLGASLVLYGAGFVLACRRPVLRPSGA
jgi:hypothetical protein